MYQNDTRVQRPQMAHRKGQEMDVLQCVVGFVRVHSRALLRVILFGSAHFSTAITCALYVICVDLSCSYAPVRRRFP